MTSLTRQRAAQLAIMGGLLDAERPEGLLDAVQRLGRVQMDPTAVVARTEHLVLYSRVGAYDRRDLERMMWKDRSLFEYWAYIVPMADLHLYRHTMERALPRHRSRPLPPEVAEGQRAVQASRAARACAARTAQVA